MIHSNLVQMHPDRTSWHTTPTPVARRMLVTVTNVFRLKWSLVSAFLVEQKRLCADVLDKRRCKCLMTSGDHFQNSTYRRLTTQRNQIWEFKNRKGTHQKSCGIVRQLWDSVRTSHDGHHDLPTYTAWITSSMWAQPIYSDENLSK